MIFLGVGFMKYIAIFISKICLFILEKIGRGTSLPGQIARKIDPNILKKIDRPKTMIAVTGSSGKTSTAYMIYQVLKENGYRVANNSKGSNLLDGVISLFLKHCTFLGKNKLDAMVLEVDERYTKQVFDQVHPTHVVLSNITRDQPPRHGDYKTVYHVIESAVEKDAILIVNADDPIATTLSFGHLGENIYYGMTKNKESYNGLVSNCLDMVYCPKCNRKLDYDYVQFSNVGAYHCSNCDFERPKRHYEITEFGKNKIQINHKFSIQTNYQMLYFFYNILAAFSCCSYLGIEEKKITKCLNNIELLNQRFEEFYFKKRKVQILTGKNENAISYNQAMNYIQNKEEMKTIIFGFEYISKRYPYQDISWLYDIDFEFLTNVDKFICIGPFAADIASRISITGIGEENILMEREIGQVAKLLPKTKGNIYAVLNMGTEQKFIEGINQLNR